MDTLRCLDKCPVKRSVEYTRPWSYFLINLPLCWHILERSLFGVDPWTCFIKKQSVLSDVAHRWISNLNSLSARNSCFYLPRLMLLDCFENFAIRKRWVSFMFCINEYQSASAYLWSNKWGQKRKRPRRKARHAGYLIPSNRTVV